MTSDRIGSARRGRIALARAHRLIGWAGLVGITLAATAAGMLLLAWSAHRAWLDESAAKITDASRASVAAPSSVKSAPVTLAVDLPRASDIPLLLTQLKQSAVAQGLDWRAADYRVIAATATQPASLEVRCSLKGSYPKLRAMLAQAISTVPALAIREFTASRPNADTPEVEAKLVLAVFLQDGADALALPQKGLR